MVQFQWSEAHIDTLLFFHNSDNYNHSTILIDYMKYILCMQNPRSPDFTLHVLYKTSKLIKTVLLSL